MRLIFTVLVVFVLISFSPVLGKADSCLESFRNFDPVEAKAKPTDRNEDYASVITMVWYGECILVGSAHGLFLYDINLPDAPITLARLQDRYIANITFNPQTKTIAFNVAQEPTLYFINSDKTVSMWKSQSQAVIDIKYSPDGSLMAIASAKIDRDYGMYYDSIVEILSTAQKMGLSTIHDSSALYSTPIFDADNKHLFLYDSTDTGSDNVTYWEVSSASRLWDYYDLLGGVNNRSRNDPLAIARASMSNHILALGGLDGYMDWDEYRGTAVHLWDVDTRQRLNEIVISRRGGRDDNSLTDLTLNHDGSILVTAQNNGAVRFWNTNDGSQIPKVIDETASVGQLSYDATDKYLALRTANTISIWDTEAVKKIASIEPLQDK